MSNNTVKSTPAKPAPWNKGKLIGQKPPLKLAEIWTVRTRLRMAGKTRDLALFNLAIDSKLRGCDLVACACGTWPTAGTCSSRASVIQQQDARAGPLRADGADPRGGAAPGSSSLQVSPATISSRVASPTSPHLSTRQYARMVKQWIALMGADPAEYGTHSLRRTKATLIYRQTKNLRAVQLLLGHRKIESTVQIPWHRRGRCPGDGRAHRVLRPTSPASGDGRAPTHGSERAVPPRQRRQVCRRRPRFIDGERIRKARTLRARRACSAAASRGPGSDPRSCASSSSSQAG